MTDAWQLGIDLAVVAMLIAGIGLFRNPRRARYGNLAAACGMVCALLAVVCRHPVLEPTLVLTVFLFGSVIAWALAARVSMTQVPAMIAFQHGAGGLAVLLVSVVELTRAGRAPPGVVAAAGLLGLIIGAATFAASMIASGKLANRLKQTPTVLPRHDLILLAVTLVMLVTGAIAIGARGQITLALLFIPILLALLLGVVFSIRVGGADMPVLISFLNSTAGVAAALCGILIQNRLLIACGATVAASGAILTHAMCIAMNRNLMNIFVGLSAGAASVTRLAVESRGASREAALPPPPRDTPGKQDVLARAVEAAYNAKTVIFIPGYGMALAHAQHETMQLANRLAELGKKVRFVVHPIAGRMPGHLHVLLAEAEVDPDMLFDMHEINSEFVETDLAIIVGACDVVNPAAASTEGTPISGMPILHAQDAKQVLICNLDSRPGYSGVENPLYTDPKSILMFGDAKQTLGHLLENLG